MSHLNPASEEAALFVDRVERDQSGRPDHFNPPNGRVPHRPEDQGALALAHFHLALIASRFIL